MTSVKTSGKHKTSIFVNVDKFVASVFELYNTLGGDSSKRVVIAGQAPTTREECNKFRFERLEMSGNKK